MERTYSLIHPDLLTITEGERTWRGADQEWFGDEWQRKAGCAPTAAAMLVSYLAQTRPPCRPLYPSGSWERMDVTALMDELWAHVTPGKKGVNTLHLFTKGFAGFAAQKGVQISPCGLWISRGSSWPGPPWTSAPRSCAPRWRRTLRWPGSTCTAERPKGWTTGIG